MQVFSLGKEYNLQNLNKEQERKRNFCLVLYPDCPEHNELITRIASNEYNFDYAGICHDKDITDEGDPKKPHYHFVLHLNNPCTRSALAKNLGIEERLVQDCKDYKGALMYLVHYKNQDKAQYSNDLVIGSLSDKVRGLTAKPNETMACVIILDLLDSIECKVEWSEFMRMVCARGLYSTFRRDSRSFRQAVYEHNSKFER